MRWPWWTLLFVAMASAEEPPAPQTEEEEGREVIEVLTGDDLKKETPPLTIRRSIPKSTISLDQAVDMPNDI